jgi:hypothetical protein
MLDRSKDRGQTEVSPWSSRLGVGHEAIYLLGKQYKHYLLRNLRWIPDERRMGSVVKETRVLRRP